MNPENEPGDKIIAEHFRPMFLMAASYWGMITILHDVFTSACADFL
ncbi:hypothetical protein [Paenibacillus kribbensis]|nr:hypothetical protein [Paenibacillus kribbensis]